MRRSNKALVLRAFFAILLFATSLVSRAQSSSQPSQQYQQPVQDLTPPSDAEVEKAAAAAASTTQQTDTVQRRVEPSKKEDGYKYVKNVDEVILYATVVDPHNKMVNSLNQSAFTVYEDGQPQKITSFHQSDVPVSLGIVIDNSGSMRDKRAEVNKAVVNLIRASNPQDEVFVVNFGQTPYLDQDFTSDVNLLQAALHQTSTRGSTALYDAVVASNVHLRNNPRLDKKVLLVITDGQDNMSRETLQDAMRKLQSNKGATLYAIGLTDGAVGISRSGREALQDLATSTGGAAFFPQRVEDVDAITRAVAHDIRSQYTLTYNPGGAIGKSYQTIRVEARGPGHSRLAVRTRTGYYPGETLR